jgi:outer membrane protein
VKAFTIVCTLIILLIAGTPVGHAQSAAPPKIGFVNSSKILAEFPEAQEAQRKLDAMGKQWQAELERMSRDLQKRYEEYQKKEALLNETEKRSQREDLIQLEQKGLQFRQEKFGSDGELAQMTDSLLTPIKQKVIKVIEQVAKDEKLQFIFDRSEQLLVMLYGDPAYDYTYRVIDRLNRAGRSTGGK